MTTPDAGSAGLTGATLHTGTMSGQITRLGVTRRIGEPPQDVTASWDWSGTLSQNDEVTLRLVVTGADGTSSTHDLLSGDISTGEMTMMIPSDTLTRLGDPWSWAASIIVNGVESPPCVGNVSGLFT